MVERQAKLSPPGCEARRKGTPARAQSSAVTGNDDFRLDEGPGFRGKSDRQIRPFPGSGRNEPRPYKAGFVFLGFSISWPSRKSLRLHGIPRPVPAPVNQRSEAITRGDGWFGRLPGLWVTS